MGDSSRIGGSHKGEKMKHKVIIHHTASSRDHTTIQMIDEWHQERLFPLSQLGYYVGYHYVIPADGVVVQMRNPDEDGCHCNSLDTGEHTSFNRSSIGIALFGNFEEEDPTEAQIVGLTALIRRLHPAVILGHRDIKDTLCPGKFLYNKIFAIKQILEEDRKLANGEAV